MKDSRHCEWLEVIYEAFAAIMSSNYDYFEI